MNKIEGTGLSIEPWETPLVEGLRPDPVPLIMTLWDLTFSQFSIHLTAHPVHSSELHMRILCETDFAQVDIVNTPFSPHPSTHAALLIIEGSQVGQA